MFYKQVEQIRDAHVPQRKSPTPCLGVIMKFHTEEEHLDEIRDEVYAHLRSKKAPATCRNIIQAMFELHHADWLGHDEILPTCPYEDCQADGL